MLAAFVSLCFICLFMVLRKLRLQIYVFRMMQTRMTCCFLQKGKLCNSSWRGAMWCSSIITLKAVVFVFTYVKGQNENYYCSVVNWKLQVVKVDWVASTSEWQVSVFFPYCFFSSTSRISGRGVFMVSLEEMIPLSSRSHHREQFPDSKNINYRSC